MGDGSEGGMSDRTAEIAESVISGCGVVASPARGSLVSKAFERNSEINGKCFVGLKPRVPEPFALSK